MKLLNRTHTYLDCCSQIRSGGRLCSTRCCWRGATVHKVGRGLIKMLDHTHLYVDCSSWFK